MRIMNDEHFKSIFIGKFSGVFWKEAKLLSIGWNSKQIYFVNLYETMYNFKSFIHRTKTKLNLFPVYVEIDCSDCDGTQAIYYRKYLTGYQFIKEYDRLLGDAEGPTYTRRISKQEFKKRYN